MRGSYIMSAGDSDVPLAMLHFLAEAPLMICSYQGDGLFRPGSGYIAANDSSQCALFKHSSHINGMMNRPIVSNAAAGCTITAIRRRK